VKTGFGRTYTPFAVSAGAVLALAVLGMGAAFAAPGGGKKSSTTIPAEARLPDMVTVIPQQLQIVNPGKGDKRELLRFSNGIANVGDGPWRMRPEFPADLDPAKPQAAIQELLDSTDSSGNVVYEKTVSLFEFHPTHNHWHIDGVALYEIRSSNGMAFFGGNDIGPVAGGNSIKTTFCLIDWIRLEGNTNNGTNSDRVYWDCFAEHQGISVGWVDQYHHALDGQDLELTNLPPGRYYLVSTANYERTFLEKDYTNNRAWVAFQLSRDSNGNARIAVVADSYTVSGEGILPTYTTNR
jgi:hypothetical protein